MSKSVLLIDNYDSFTYMLSDYIKQCGVECIVVRNDETELIGLNPINFLALVISPGPETPQLAGQLMQVIPDFLAAIPVLGICLGHQAIGLHYGANLVQAKIPRHGKVDRLKHFGNELFLGVKKTFLATRYHSLILKNLPSTLEPICMCNKEIMGLAHNSLPIYGLQFHPESCQTEGGLQMVKNFIDMAKRMAQI
jgi:anthranilate synthase/aminodeoxychorismate synthase-like glutamine amidotransferase